MNKNIKNNKKINNNNNNFNNINNNINNINNMNSSFNNFFEYMNRKTFNLTNENLLFSNKNRKYLIKDMVKIVQININSFKMIHSLSLKIFIIKLYYCSDKRIFANFIKNWKIMKKNNENNFMKIKGFDKGLKNHSISVIYEYCPFGSLKDLLNNLEFLNENSVIELIYYLFKNIKIFQNKFKREFGDIRTTQILFNRSKELVLNFGSSNLILDDNFSSNKTFLNDVFRIGLLGLSCSLGFYINTIIEILIKIFDELFCEISKADYYKMINLNYYFNINSEKIMFQPNKYLSKEYCCFLHFILGKKRSYERESFYQIRIKKYKNLYKDIKILRSNLKEFIKINFNKNFINYFCFITRFIKDERLNLEQSLNHQYIDNFLKYEINDNSINLKNFIILNNDPLRNSNKIDFYSEKIFQSIINIQNNSIKWYSLNSCLYLTNNMNLNCKQIKILDIDCEEIQNISLELGISKERLWEYFSKINL